MLQRHILMAALVVLVGAAASPTVWAQDPIHKMGRGVVNVLTGWMEIPKQLSLGKQEDNPVSGLAQGLFKGATLTLLRMGVGVYEALSFPFPYPKGFASPYEGMELTDYAWE